MDEDTTTVQPVVDTGAEALPVVQDEAQSADVQAVAEPSEAQQDVVTDTPDVDDKLTKYAQSQGFELDSPSAIKAARIAMQNQSEATRNYQKASELEKTANITQEQLPADATSQDVDNARVRNLELKMEVQSWKMSNQDKLELEPQMIQVLSDPNKKAMLQEGYLSLDDIYKIAKADAPDNTAQVKSQAKQETLQALAHKQTAAVPTGHATTAGTPSQKPFGQLSREEMRAKLGVHKR